MSAPIPVPPEPLSFQIRPAEERDIDALSELEQASFSGDRLSRRRFRHWVKADNRVFLVAELDQTLLGYVLVLLRRGTRLARLYSLAVGTAGRGQGVGKALLTAAEDASSHSGRLYMRLEVAEQNSAAIALYKQLGYRTFGSYANYYEDAGNALRMQKRIRYRPENLHTVAVPWYGQRTEFTCGPAAAMMAMAGLDPGYVPNASDELALWREATTIFMTSGHGGCHPIGLALAMQKRGFTCEVYLNQSSTLFIDSVRNPKKKAVMEQVDADFRREAESSGLHIVEQDFTQGQCQHWLEQGALVLLLISTYRLDGKKVPHWVTLTGMDAECFYVHDPDADDEDNPLDSQYLPIAREEISLMSSFGKEKLRTAIVIKKKR
ncbi:GNAT family N-acetyltransferase/peptidase C39 family protein [Microbulbifer pacificus]|uniref:GNAT family N-acetyltransferase/peptidase C39 family protein n=1 Tax=Microbulbifer pacificus TaxID=407164 RepID=A0AAU0MV47_9GAMM|nr:GNAT family N-acetyltransferase/peptidase C39 family protein [Microbulbifer pacificus]WOX03912.1 GNAT family N-acetyltransferase/peptidase C39 family protein [Microbulbifer pacificus]